MKFEGIMPALVTPLDADERINVKVLNELLETLIGKGADGFYIGGATGEGLKLRTEERMILAEESIKTIDGRVPSIIQVASMNFNDAVALTKHAEKIGADAISATPPLFFQYDEDDVYNYYKALADASSLPVMVYYSTSAGFNMSADFAARLFEIDNVTAIKWTSSNYYEMSKLKDITNGEMNIINGPDEMLLQGLCAGADGGIGLNYSFQLENVKAIYDSFKKGDLVTAQEMQTKLNRIISVLLKYKLIPVTKIILEEMGFAVGNAAFPMKRYAAEEKAKIIAEFRQVGLKF